MRSIVTSGAAAVLALVVVTSCGGDDDTADATSPPEEDITGNEAMANDDAPAGNARSDGAGSNEFCEAFAPLNEEGDALLSDGAPSSSAELRDLLERMRVLEPPPEVATDFALLNEAFGLVAESIDGDVAARAELDQRSAEFDAADENLEPFMREVCGLDFGD